MDSRKSVTSLIATAVLGLSFLSFSVQAAAMDPTSVASSSQTSTASAANQSVGAVNEQASNSPNAPVLSDSKDGNVSDLPLLGTSVLDIKPPVASMYVLNPEGKAILIDGRPVHRETLENGSPRFYEAYDDLGRLRGYCDALKVCYPLNSPALSFQDPDSIPLVLMSHNQYIDRQDQGKAAESSDTDAQDEDASNKASDQQLEKVDKPNQAQIPDATKNDPQTTAPLTRSQCESAAANKTSLPNLSSGCIEAANKQLPEKGQIPAHCASDFIGPPLPSQSSECAKHPLVKGSADAVNFADAGSTEADDKPDKKKKPTQDAKPSDQVGDDASVAERALAKIEDKQQNPENNQEAVAQSTSKIDETRGDAIESISANPNKASDNSEAQAEDNPNVCEAPAHLKELYGLPDQPSDEDNQTPESITEKDADGTDGTESIGNGQFYSNFSSNFDDEGGVTDGNDDESRPASQSEENELSDLLGLDAKKAAEPDPVDEVKVKTPNESNQEDRSASTGVETKQESGDSDSGVDPDVADLKLNLNAADKDIDSEKENLSAYDEKTGVKILRKNKDGFIAQSIELKAAAKRKAQRQALMDRFQLTEEQLNQKIEACQKVNPKAESTLSVVEECLKNDASLFAESLIMQDN